MTDAVIIDALLATVRTAEGMYGRRKMVAFLRRQGHDVSARRVDRLMRHLDLQGRIRGQPVRTKIPDRNASRVPDPLDRDFTAPAPNQRWVADFTYVRNSPQVDGFVRGDSRVSASNFIGSDTRPFPERST